MAESGIVAPVEHDESGINQPLPALVEHLVRMGVTTQTVILLEKHNFVPLGEKIRAREPADTRTDNRDPQESPPGRGALSRPAEFARTDSYTRAGTGLSSHTNPSTDISRSVQYAGSNSHQ